MENRSNAPNNKHGKLFWGAITWEEIKQAVSFKKSHQNKNRCLSVLRSGNYGLPICGKSYILNSLIREHFFGNNCHRQSIKNYLKFDENKSTKLVENLRGKKVNCNDDVSTNDLNEQSEGVVNESGSDLTTDEENDKLEENDVVEQNNIEIEHNLCNIMEEHKYNKRENKSLLIKDEENSGSLTEINVHHNGNDINNSVVRLEKSMIDTKKSLNNTLEEINIILDDDNNFVTPLRTNNVVLGLSDSKRKFLSDKCEQTIASLGDIVKKKILFKQPSKILHKTPNFKNIVSPVAMYIKNPSTIPQIQHVPNCEIDENLFKSSGVKVASKPFNEKENINLPFRVYRPAKKTIVTQETNIKLPQNIQKQISLTPQIIKHSRRIRKVSLSEAQLEAQLLRDDLTGRFSESLNLSKSLQDISLLTATETYIK